MCKGHDIKTLEDVRRINDEFFDGIKKRYSYEVNVDLNNEDREICNFILIARVGGRFILNELWADIHDESKLPSKDLDYLKVLTNTMNEEANMKKFLMKWKEERRQIMDELKEIRKNRSGD
jgi:hypothetical protein